MDEKTFINKMSKYSKEVILKTIFQNFFFSTEEILRTIKITNQKYKLDNLMAESNKIMELLKNLEKKEDCKSFREYVKYLNKEDEIQKRILKEMDKI